MKRCESPCILPWVSFGTNPFGKSRPCGYSAFKGKVNVQDSTISAEFNNDLFKSIRLDFLSGKWPENCEKCRYTEETQPQHSKKTDSEFYAPPYRGLFAQTRADGSVNHFPKFIDIRLGTVCNLKCIHCGTGNSNKWLEDKELLGKYSNTQVLNVDNSWIDRETPIWQDIYAHIHEIEKFNFIGGEPFASVQHNKFIEQISNTEHARRISLHYVTNGVLLSDKLWNTVQKFKEVAVNVSLDATGDVLEFFRFPIKSSDLVNKLKRFELNKGPHVDLSVQWTSSNVSIFYLDQTLDFFEKNFRNITFRFCNFVEYPHHMSPQNLPVDVKKLIVSKLTSYLKKYPVIELYLRQMTDGELWPSQSTILHNYLNDLSQARNLDWKDSFKEFSQKITPYFGETWSSERSL